MKFSPSVHCQDMRPEAQIRRKWIQASILQQELRTERAGRYTTHGMRTSWMSRDRKACVCKLLLGRTRKVRAYGPMIESEELMNLSPDNREGVKQGRAEACDHCRIQPRSIGTLCIPCDRATKGGPRLKELQPDSASFKSCKFTTQMLVIREAHRLFLSANTVPERMGESKRHPIV